MSSQLILKNFKQNEFASTGMSKSLYNDALKYYGYNDNPNRVIYPIPILKHSRTYTKQASLPSLPVQPLKKSLEKYLVAVRPLLNENEFENTNKIVHKFMKPGGIGERLQQLLYERSKNTDNWVCTLLSVQIFLSPVNLRVSFF
jgi:hypothetical protein